MGAGLRKIKQEMKGTGGGRWEPLAVAKSRSKKARRVTDKKVYGKERFRAAVAEFATEHKELLLELAKTEAKR